jgi:hypothetical protein
MQLKLLVSSMFDMAIIGLALGSGYKFGLTVAEKIDTGISNGIKSVMPSSDE